MALSIAVKSRNAQNPPPIARRESEPKKSFHFELGDIRSRFELKEKKDIRGPRTIFEVVQLHSSGELARDEKSGAAPFIIQNQKDIEALINYVGEEYGIHTFFLEGLDLAADTEAAFLYKYLNQCDGLFNTAMRNGDTAAVQKLLATLIEDYDKNSNRPDLDEFQKATLGYFLRVRLRKFLPFATTEDRPGFELKLAELAEQRLIKGDNLYITLGGPWKARIDGEGKFNLETGDNRAAAMEMLEVIRNTPKESAPAEAKEKHQKRLVELSRIREDAAVASTNAWMDAHRENKTFYVIGSAHNSTGNVKRYNSRVESSKRCSIARVESNVVRAASAIDFPGNVPLELNDADDEKW